MEHRQRDRVLAEGQRVLIDDPARFDGVKVIGVDEHVWRPAVVTSTSGGDQVDLTRDP